MTEYAVVIEQDRGAWGAYVPDLPGCLTVGETRVEVEKFIVEAIPRHLSSLLEHGEPVPAPVATGSMPVMAARAPKPG